MNIKLTNVALIIGVVALIVNVVLGVMYFQQRGERESLTSELAEIKQSFSEYDMADDLEKQVGDAEARLEEAQQAATEAKLMAEQAYSAENLSNGGILDGVLRLAQESQVNVVNISTQPKGNEVREGHIYSTLSIDLSVTGSLTHLAVFAHKLENGEIKAVTIDDISIRITSAAYAATMNFSVFYPRETEL